jgi:hypothetical protein
MIDAKLVQSLPQIAPPVLTAYLETNPADSRNLRHPARYLIWLKSQAKGLEEGLQKNELKALREQVHRLEEYLTENPPRLLGNADGVHTVLGVDDTLAGLQEGLTRDAVVEHGIAEQVRQCTKCGWIDRTPDAICRACGGARLVTGLRAVLPQLAKRIQGPVGSGSRGSGSETPQSRRHWGLAEMIRR